MHEVIIKLQDGVGSTNSNVINVTFDGIKDPEIDLAMKNFT